MPVIVQACVSTRPGGVVVAAGAGDGAGVGLLTRAVLTGLLGAATVVEDRGLMAMVLLQSSGSGG
ncbi:hypothetical protein [Amantichitinum ursilacus]|uniref:hypothetical protein n=1 Tax=Amantichitinum ursilacus TaxID=857265 RepID=UPI0006B5729E|nr:hypothetical protein [Amantichitinum ursilacus]